MPAPKCGLKKKCGNSHDTVQNRKISKAEIAAKQQLKMSEEAFEKWKIHNEPVIEDKKDSEALKHK